MKKHRFLFSAVSFAIALIAAWAADAFPVHPLFVFWAALAVIVAVDVAVVLFVLGANE